MKELDEVPAPPRPPPAPPPPPLEVPRPEFTTLPRPPPPPPAMKPVEVLLITTPVAVTLIASPPSVPPTEVPPSPPAPMILPLLLIVTLSTSIVRAGTEVSSDQMKKSAGNVTVSPSFTQRLLNVIS